MSVNKITSAPTENELIGKVNEIIDDKVSNTDYATSSVGGVIRTSSTTGTDVSSAGVLYASNSSYATYQNASNYFFVSKGTLENVLSSRGYTDNVGTVTSVNNTSPDSNGNVTISIPTTTDSVTSGSSAALTSGGAYTALSNKQDNLPSQTGQSGKYLTTDGSSLSWGTPSSGGSVAIDNSTITKNASDQIQTVGVKDVRTDNTLKTWTGTRAQYEAITTKDSNTLYNITDDTDVTSTLLDLLYPVGAVYIGTMASCPLATLGIGTWTEQTSRFLVDKYVNGTDWWELYSDGWCRQGGMFQSNDCNDVQINFLKTFSDTNYTPIVGQMLGSSGDATYWNFAIYSRTVSSMTIHNATNGTGNYCAWEASGYTSSTTGLKMWRRTA